MASSVNSNLHEWPWMRIAKSYVGTREIPGPKHDPTIMGFVRALGGKIASWVITDETPWCASYVNAVLQEAGVPMSAKPGSADLLRAKAFSAYGTQLDEPSYGCLLVFDRAGGGHVGFYVGETLKHYRVLGGNQSDSVNESWLDKTRCIAIRWPATVQTPITRRVWLRPTGEPISENER